MFTGIVEIIGGMSLVIIEPIGTLLMKLQM